MHAFSSKKSSLDQLFRFLLGVLHVLYMLFPYHKATTQVRYCCVLTHAELVDGGVTCVVAYTTVVRRGASTMNPEGLHPWPRFDTVVAFALCRKAANVRSIIYKHCSKQQGSLASMRH